ncbi:MAG: ABC transporter permease [Chloroflexi bacterium]|nr:ABC transporter permease [Chloroflexota bacterium]
MARQATAVGAQLALGPRPRRPWLARLESTAAFLFPILVLIGAWEVVSRVGLVNPILMPPPSRVFSETLRYMTPAGGWLLWHDAGMSAYRLLAGSVLAVVVGIPLGMGIGMVPAIYRFFTPILSILLPIPSLAWVPIVILWLGIGDATPIFIVFLSGIFPIVYNTSAGARSMDYRLIWAAQTMGARNLRLFLGVILPGSLGHIVTGVKLAVGGGWRSLVAAEMLAASMFGLGFRIFQAKGFMQIELMYAGIIWLAVLGFLLENGVFVPLETSTLRRWGMLREL